jgi:hypothetical protein
VRINWVACGFLNKEHDITKNPQVTCIFSHRIKITLDLQNWIFASKNIYRLFCITVINYWILSSDLIFVKPPSRRCSQRNNIWVASLVNSMVRFIIKTIWSYVFGDPALEREDALVRLSSHLTLSSAGIVRVKWSGESWSYLWAEPWEPDFWGCITCFTRKTIKNRGWEIDLFVFFSINPLLKKLDFYYLKLNRF